MAFVAAVLFVGLWKSKGEDTHGEEGAADYFLAGCGLTWWRHSHSGSNDTGRLLDFAWCCFSWLRQKKWAFYLT